MPAMAAELAALQASFRPSAEIAALADRAHAALGEYGQPHHWESSEAPKFPADDRYPAKVWRRASAQIIEGGLPPFRTQGVVEGVSPLVLALVLTDIEMKDHERNKPDHERSTERKLVQQLDLTTRVWWEVDKYPWPLAARETLYCERWVSDSSGDRVAIVRTSIELPSEHPVGPGRVRAKQFVAHELERSANGTLHTITMEFNVGGNIPGRLVNAFLNGQTHTFRNLSRFFDSDEGKRRGAKFEALLAAVEGGGEQWGVYRRDSPSYLKSYIEADSYRADAPVVLAPTPPTMQSYLKAGSYLQSYLKDQVGSEPYTTPAQVATQPEPEHQRRSISAGTPPEPDQYQRSLLRDETQLLRGTQPRGWMRSRRRLGGVVLVLSLVVAYSRRVLQGRAHRRVLQAFADALALLGPGWLFLVTALGGGGLLVLDMIVAAVRPEKQDPGGTANINANCFRLFLLKMQKEWRIAPEKR